jgi:DDE domain
MPLSNLPVLNNVEQGHRGIKRRVNARQGFRSLDGAWRTIQDYEILHLIRKGQVRWLPKREVLGETAVGRRLSDPPVGRLQLGYMIEVACTHAGGTRPSVRTI